MARQPLRFAVLCDGLHLKAWQARAIEQLLSSGCADLVLVVFAHDGTDAAASKLRTRLARLVRRRGAGTRANMPTSCQDLFRGADRFRCQTRRQDGGSDFAPSDSDVIAGHHPDFILAFHPDRPCGAILSAARYGVWAYDFADERSSTAAPPSRSLASRSLAGASAHTRTVRLLRLHGPQSGVCLYHGVLPRSSAGAPIADVMRFTGAAFCLRVCRAILAGDLSSVHSTAVQPLASAPGRVTLGEILRRPVHRVADWVSCRLHKWFCYDLWNIGLISKTIEELCDAGQLSDVAWSPYQVGYQFVADPFVLSEQDGLLLLLERFDYNRNCKGLISRCKAAPDRGWSELADVLDREYHLSYPYIFECHGEVYCTPENHEAGRCDLYRVTGAGELEFVRTILDDWDVIDPTIFFHAGFWWLFFTQGGSVELYAFHADRLDGTWTGHALNPLKCDVTSARPAGPPFRRNGDLYRPAQDCSRTYGGAVVINRIIELTPDRFREEVACRIAPEAGGAYRHGFHTLNVLDRTCVVDGKRRVIDPTWVLRGWVFGARTRERRNSLRPANRIG